MSLYFALVIKNSIKATYKSFQVSHFESVLYIDQSQSHEHISASIVSDFQIIFMITYQSFICAKCIFKSN